ncbi:hypothetical protein TCAL_14324 [Tigriopus californicus]|uniref:Ionotropic glutamate receptor L-glutamate and glycine-binding domain-containing protein n=1 Tax=Tigriopus californicus TaxID=6832 RepID=A0A553NCC9_TIGCA|nr:hypothetical protein TCAL_14324 [Tigriopus californicus]
MIDKFSSGTQSENADHSNPAKPSLDIIHRLAETKQSTILISDLREPAWLSEKQLRCALVITDDWLSIREASMPVQVVLLGGGRIKEPQVPILVHHFSDIKRYVATRAYCPNRDWIPLGTNPSLIRWEPKFGCPSMEPFKVSYRGLPPYVYHLPTGSVGLDIDLVRILAQKLKMNLEMFEFDSWIDIDPQTGALGGSVGLVMNGTYDMVVGNLPFPVGVIKKSTNLTTFIYDLDIKMTTAKPRPLTPLLNVIRPFSPTIWMTSFGTIIFCGMVFALKSRSHKIRSQVILWWMLGVLLSQSRSSKGLRRAKVHLIMVVWMFFTFCLKHFYECNFRANLIAVDYEPTIDSIPDLVKLGRRLYIPSGTQFQDMLDGYPDPNFKFLGQMARQEGLMFNYDEQGLVEYEAEQIILKNGKMNDGKKRYKRISVGSVIEYLIILTRFSTLWISKR